METNAEITIEAVRAWLQEDNPRCGVGDLEQYAHQLVTYYEASVSVLALGAVVAHPRTAAPMENPHLKVRAQALSAMQKIKRVKRADVAWRHIRAATDEILRKRGQDELARQRE